MQISLSPVARIVNLVRDEKTDISAIYFFAALGGLVQLSLPLGIQAIIGFVLGGTLSASLVVLIAVLVAGVLLTGLLQVAQMKLIEKIQQRIFVRFAYAFSDRIPRLDLKKVDAFYLPELVNRFFDTVSLQKSLSKLLLDLPTATIQILFGLIVLSFYHPFFILFGVLLLLLLWLILYATARKGMQSSLAESTHKYGLAGWLEEMARLVKSFKFSLSTGLHLKKADEKTIYYLKARSTHFSVLLLQYRTLVAFKVAITGAMLVAGVALLLNQQINIGQFVAAELIILMVIGAVEKIMVNLDAVYDVLTAIEKIGKLTDKPVDSFGTYKPTGEGAFSLQGIDLHFAYEGQKAVIRNLSFAITAGEKACITGPDGSGKSTLLKLITGMYRDFDGSLLLNNIPIRNFDLRLVRERTGIHFPQENVFHGTLWENITMGREQIDEGYINYLVQQTGLNSFLSGLPFGYDTELDPTGKRLPKSMLQKILLVRALAHKPKLVVMEEPWSSIDLPVRQQIQRLLLNLTNTTVIVATNDEEFIRQCSKKISLTT